MRDSNTGFGFSITEIGKEKGCRRSKVRENEVSYMLTAGYLHIIREMQLFLIGYIIIEIAEIFSVGEFPLPSTVRIVCGVLRNQT